MESGALLTKAKKLLGAQVLESARLGRGTEAVIWVSTQAVVDVLRVLRDDEQLKLDFLENLGAMHMEGAIVVSYFLRSRVHGHALVVRSTQEPKKSAPIVSFPSISGLYPAATVQEREIEELLGARFEPRGTDTRPILASGWEGFPLRKDYAFPREFLGIAHVRSDQKGSA